MCEIESQAYSQIEIRDFNIFITFDWTIICEGDNNRTKISLATLKSLNNVHGNCL